MPWNKTVSGVSYLLTMKCQQHLMLCMASFLASNWTAMAEPPTMSVNDGYNPYPPGAIRVELKQMLIADATNITEANQNKTKVVIANLNSAKVITMSPYIVRGVRTPDFNKPKSEIPIVRWLKDGTLYEKFGETFTTGAKLTFYQTTSPLVGNIKPVSGVKVGFSWSW